MRCFFLFFCVLLFHCIYGDDSAFSVARRVVGSFPHVSVKDAEFVRGGYFNIPGSDRVLDGLPSFLRLAFVSDPSGCSNIGIEVWLPERGWNGRFLGTGNGGGAGHIDYGALARGLKRGFAVANTDMGTFPYANEVVDFPERWHDFGYRATHEMTVVGKCAVFSFYGRVADFSYFLGCSTGGQQALSEAQRFPNDYDGIVAGAPANNRTHLHMSFLWNYKVLQEVAGGNLSYDVLRSVTDAIVRGNVGKDGGAPDDDFLTDPRLASFDFNCLKGRLNEKQIRALELVFEGASDTISGERIYTAFPLGSESSPMGLGYQGDISVTEGQFYPFLWVWGKGFNARSFDFGRDPGRVDSILAPILNANDPDLRPFRDHGGKLLMYTGTCDPIVPFQDAVYYYERVSEMCGGLDSTQCFFRYFIIPGMAHCCNGPGANEFGQSMGGVVPEDGLHDLMTIMIRWVEGNKAPDRIIVTGFTDGDPKRGIRMQRPAFPYPAFPHYIGGDRCLPESFKAVIHERGNVPIPSKRFLK